MTDDRSIFDRLKERGEEVLAQVSAELMANQHFMKAMEGAVRGKEFVDQAVGRTLKGMNVPTRSDLKKVLSRLEALESEMTALKKAARAKAKAAPKKAAVRTSKAKA